MVLIKCGCCSKLIENRAKSIYNNEVDKFYCNEFCQKKDIDYLNSKLPSLKDKNGQLYWDFHF